MNQNHNTNLNSYMHLARFMDLVRNESFSSGTHSRLEFLLYQLSLAMLREERFAKDGTACAEALSELEPLNRLLVEEGRHSGNRTDIDRTLLNGLEKIVAKMEGEPKCFMSARYYPTMNSI